ncbi:tetratricopeptide repeat protein [Crocosphaera sp. Alani8]|uniref:tetratricopeptide repeat protein n=1 Tax=Crocosphaera sp. Alani8 TaxID=3038952 RepID=UPI00313C758B
MWEVILNAIAWLNEFWTTHQKDILMTTLSGIGIATIGVIFSIIVWLFKRWRKKRQLERDKKFSQPKLPFQLVKPNGDVYSLLYPPESDYKNPVLADRNIPYQRRIHEKNTTQELSDLLFEHRWVLIMGRTGIGKTREAAEVAQKLNNEGWTVLKLKLGEWLDRPNNEQLQAIGTDRKLLFLLDDLHQFMRRSENIEKHPQGKDNLALPINIPLQERLLDTLKAYENDVADPQEIRVLAITRNEKEGYYSGQDSPWDKLQWDKYQKLWDKFYVYKMPDPENGAVVELFKNIIPETNIKKETDYIDLAVSNDGTFRNVVENLVTLDNGNLALNKQNFKETLQGTWDKRYKKAIEGDNLAEFIYDGIDLLQQCNVPLNELLVKETALLMVRGNWLQRLWYGFRVQKSLNCLIEIERILNPRDGQIEERGNRVDITDYWYKLEKLILRLFKSDSQLMTDALTNFSLYLYQKNRYKHSLKCYQQLVTVVKEDADILFNLATTYAYLERYDEAILSYDKALEFKPDYDAAWYNRGIALKNLGRLDEAILSYDKALEFKPDDDAAWYNRGIALKNLGRLDEAILSYDKAIEIKPDDDAAWYNRGIALKNLGRLDEAILSYDKALEFKPDDDAAWYNRGIALKNLGRLDEAILSYDKALEFKPDDDAAWYNRGIALKNLGRLDEAILSYDKAIEIKPDYDAAWYNRGNALDDLGRLDEAILSYDKALEFKPDYDAAWYNRGNALDDLGRLDEAILSYDKAIEIKPDKYEAIFNKALCYAELKDVETFDKLFATLPQDYRDNLLNNPDFQTFIDNLHGNNNSD